MSPVAQLMLHGWEEGDTRGADKNTGAALDESVKNMEAAMLERVKSKSKMTDEQIANIFADSSHHYFTAAQALEAGLVDEICW
jgi:ATP-dependent protease ClpP protease subunit